VADGARGGVRVNVADRNEMTVRSERPFHLRQARARWREDGWKAAVYYYVEVWRSRGGWNSR
jgi:hypothetical protein